PISAGKPGAVVLEFRLELHAHRVEHAADHRVESRGHGELDVRLVIEVLHRFGIGGVAHLAARDIFRDRERRLLPCIELGGILPGGQGGDLPLRDAGLARHPEVLRPFIGRAHDLGAAQDEKLAQRARRLAFVADRAGELGPRGDELRVIGEGLVEVGGRAPQLFEPLLGRGLELRERNAFHGAHNSSVDIRGFQLTRPPADFFDDPYRYYAALREQDPLHELEGGGIFVSRYDDALAVYRDPRASSDKKVEFKPKLGDSPLYEHHTTSLVFNDPPLHTRVRRLIMGALTQRAMARMESQVVRLVDALLDEMQEKRRVDFILDFAAQIPIEVIGNLLDIPRPERSPLRAWSTAILSGLEPKLTPEMFERGNTAVREFVAFLEKLIAERRKRPGDPEADVLTRLIQGEKDGERLTETELHHQCIFLLNA